MHLRRPRQDCMQLASRSTSLVLGLAASIGLAVCRADQAYVKPTPVEVWRVGDDGLTTRLRDALESALRASPDFMLSSGNKAGSLVVTIQDHVRWKTISAGKTQVTYAVEFSTVNHEKIGTSTGSCRDDFIEKCAAQIVTEARIARRKIH